MTGGMVESNVGVFFMTEGGVESNVEVEDESSTGGVVESNEEIGWVSITGGMVLTKLEVGRSSVSVAVVTSLVGEGAEGYISRISIRGISAESSVDFRRELEGVRALFLGLEDNRCSLLGSTTPALSRAALGVPDGGVTDFPLRSFLTSGTVSGSGSGWNDVNSVAGGGKITINDGAVRSTAEDAVESMVKTVVAAASCSGVSWTRV